MENFEIGLPDNVVSLRRQGKWLSQGAETEDAVRASLRNTGEASSGDGDVSQVQLLKEILNTLHQISAQLAVTRSDDYGGRLLQKADGEKLQDIFDSIPKGAFADVEWPERDIHR